MKGKNLVANKNKNISLKYSDNFIERVATENKYNTNCKLYISM